MGQKKRLCLVLASIMMFGCFLFPAAAVETGTQEAQIAERRATGQFDFEIPANTLMKASSSFPLEYGEAVTITAVYSPRSANLDFGLIDSDGIFYSIQASDGSFDKTIKITQRGTYTFAVRNNSSYDVSVSGFVNY